MNIASTVTAACTKKAGTRSGIAVEEGQHLKIETSPGGEDILDMTVPAGKIWDLEVSVEIQERDA